MKPFSEWDFTLPKYEKLCRTILHSNYRIFTINDFLIGQKTLRHETSVIMRHDVDRRPSNALRMARIESKLGIKSTYYFRARSSTFKPAIIEEIADLGHEIGYHYENLSDTAGDMEDAIRDFESNLMRFRALVPIRTICMHGSPCSKWDNRDLWRRYDYRNFGLLGDPYLSIDYTNIAYLSDTGRTWRSNRFNIRDKIDSGTRIEVDSTSELIKVVKSQINKRLLILSHPERWTDHIISYCCSFCFDECANTIKAIIMFAK